MSNDCVRRREPTLFCLKLILQHLIKRDFRRQNTCYGKNNSIMIFTQYSKPFLSRTGFISLSARLHNKSLSKNILQRR